MSELKEKLLEDMKKAMKEKDKKRLSVIRMSRAAIKNEEISKTKELDDDEVIGVLSKQVKQLRDSLVDYRKSGKEDAIRGIEEEIEILKEYLPRQLTEEEIKEIVDEVTAEVGAEDMSDMGKVMGAIMPRVKGKADGKLVNSIVRDKLNQ